MTLYGLLGCYDLVAAARVVMIIYHLLGYTMLTLDFFIFLVVIDKDQKPAWNPAKLEGVSAATVDAYFAPLPADQELNL
jgi:hypothetical protein